MTLIKPNSHLVNIPVNVLFSENNPVGSNLLRISVQDFEDHPLLYSGKVVVMSVDTENILGRYIVSVDGGTYFQPNSVTTISIPTGTQGSFQRAYPVRNDNENITYGDILYELSKNDSNFTVNGIEFVGKYGLLSPTNNNKLKTLVSPEKYDFGFNVNTTSFQHIGTVRMDYINDVFNHTFGISGGVLNAFFDISLNSLNKSLLNVRKTIFNNIDGTQIVVELIFTYGEIAAGKYISIQAKTTVTGSIGAQSPLHKIIHYTPDRANVLMSAGSLVNTEIYTYKSRNPSNYDSDLSNFIFRKEILSYNNYEIQISGAIRNIIANTTNLNTLTGLGNYLGVKASISTYTNVPVGVTENFNLFVMELGAASGTYNILQRISSFYDDSGVIKPLMFERIITNSGVSPWVNTTTHTHPATSIITDVDHLFVTQAQIDYWNTLTTTTTWKAPVANTSDLPISYATPATGWCVYITTTNEIYKYNGTAWVPLITTASTTSNGIITATMYNEFFIGSSLSKRINNQNSYIHRFSVLSTLELGQIDNNAYDLVQRTSLPYPIQPNTIGIGFGTTGAYGEKSIAIGTNLIARFDDNIMIGSEMLSAYIDVVGIGKGLAFNLTGQMAIGRYNVGDANNLFEIGNGTGTGSRSNLFSISNAGITNAGGYKTPTGTNNDLLLADGSTITKSALLSGELAASKKTIVVKPEDQIANIFTLVWDSTLVDQFGHDAIFEVYMLTGEDIYNKEEVPIKMFTETIEDTIDPEIIEVHALKYEFTLSGIQSLIIIR